MKSHLKSTPAAYLMIFSLLGLTNSSYAQEKVGGSDLWPEKLQSLYHDVMSSQKALQQQYPDAKIPQELQSWLTRFTNDPFSNTQPQHDLNQVGEQLSKKYDSAQLNQTPESQQQFDQFMNVVRDISSGLTSSIAGNDKQTTISLEGLSKVHNTNQEWIDTKGKELAELYQKFNIQGVLVNLNGTLQELQQQYQQQKTER
jgi:mannitol-1-phosphate/altronate dehydrogenase